MNLREFSRAADHVQAHFAKPLSVCDVSNDGFATAEDIDAFCAALLSSSKLISSTMLATQRYTITIERQPEPAEEENGND